MGNCNIMKYMLSSGAMWLFWIRPIGAVVCDFSRPQGLLESNALVTCQMDISYFDAATVICPRRVNDTEYVWNPQAALDGHGRLNAYVSDEGTFRSVALPDVVRTESDDKLFWIGSNNSQTELHLDIPIHEVFAITEGRLIFICGPQDLVLSYILQRHLERLGGFPEMQSFPWVPATPLTEEITKIGNALGVVFMNRGNAHLPLQGCGSRPSPLFAPGNEVTVDPITGTRSCVADPMSESPIGFVCEGRLEPEDCMRSLIDESGEVVAAPESHPYWSFVDHRPWVIAKYFNDFALPPFYGECICMDSETGQVKAKIEIRSKNEYVCDIASMIDHNHLNTIRSPWCSVVLHPGSTLTIKLPTQQINSASTGMTSDYADKDVDMDVDEDLSTVAFSQLPPAYEYETEFLPKDMTTLNQLSVPYVAIYHEISYHEVLAGDALELDISQMYRGEIKLQYNVGKPLALRSGLNSFRYHLTLTSTNENVPSTIYVIVNISFAFTHEYGIIGCDRRSQGSFDQDISRRYCSMKSVANGIGDVYECSYNKTWNISWAGIHCTPDETLLPGDCEFAAYDLYSNRIIPFPASVRHATVNPIPGFQVLGFKLHNNPASYACICVDQRGYERSKLIIECNHQETHRYAVRRELASHTLRPHLLIPWHEARLSSEEHTLPKSLMLHHVQQNTITIQAGTTLMLYCEVGVDVLGLFDEHVDIHANPIRKVLKWLPDQPEEFYYTANYKPNGPELVRKRYKDSIATTSDGFRVVYDISTANHGYETLKIKYNRRSILVSKDLNHKKYVPITFVCGKTPEPSDLSIVTDNVQSSNAFVQDIPHIIGLPEQYTWHVVNVAVETTDPYMQGCGVTYESTDLFKPETPQLYGAYGQPQFGCKIDLQAAKEAAFYCPAPYLLDPPNCFSQVYVDGIVKNTRDLSQSLVASQSNHFVILSFDGSLVGPGETLRQTPPLECRCVTVRGIVLSTIQIEKYYAK
ncbi:hypothetical protein, conserved [Babesia ovata]|uniref:6-Cys domain-containing protein n=1 Tax=Babesia ovata TaxID=189622 RepID=A0A2H6KGD6_9APIC|nr:uncharacterized protein BOVATA_035480 [Babesia ovata]GBE62055.1 hypothetical protein, conserved [Babesia ovata]